MSHGGAVYDDLHHPPATYIGAKYQYRSADGSNNNICVPDMGKASMPYARSVQQMYPVSLDTLPDPGLVFDTLLKRQKVRSFLYRASICHVTYWRAILFFSVHNAPGWAVQHDVLVGRARHSYVSLIATIYSSPLRQVLIIALQHSVFRTSHGDVSINETSSYVDLAPLYGNDQKTLDNIRLHNGRGMIHPDRFSEDRLLLLPPAVSVLLVLFNRNHNVGIWSSSLVASSLNCYL